MQGNSINFDLNLGSDDQEKSNPSLSEESSAKKERGGTCSTVTSEMSEDELLRIIESNNLLIE